MSFTKYLVALTAVLFIRVIKTSTDLSLENKINDRRHVNIVQPSAKPLQQNLDDDINDVFKLWSISALDTVADALDGGDSFTDYKPIVRIVEDAGAFTNDHEEHVPENKYKGDDIRSRPDSLLNSNVLNSAIIDDFQKNKSKTLDSISRSNLSDTIVNIKSLADGTLNTLNKALNQKVWPSDATNTSDNKTPTKKDSLIAQKRNIWSFMNSNNHMTCDIDVIQTSMMFSENIDTSGGRITLVCRGQVVVNKCEGTCSSSVTPDVNHYDGYLKQCSCCRDSSTRQRDVTLSSCFIGGSEVSGHFLTRTIVEPSTCACLECRG